MWHPREETKQMVEETIENLSQERSKLEKTLAIDKAMNRIHDEMLGEFFTESPYDENKALNILEVLKQE